MLTTYRLISYNDVCKIDRMLQDVDLVTACNWKG